MTQKSSLYLGARALLAYAGLLMLPGCAIHRQAYFVSPFNGNNTEYHTLPTMIDSVHTALYSSLSISPGSANDFGTDHYLSGKASIYVAHQVGYFQFHYGLNLSLGNYSMGMWQVDTSYYRRSSNTDLPHAAQVNSYSGDHFFGGIGFEGGVNLVVPMGGAEWRFLGVETSVTQEFGNYLAVRRQMPDSIANLINRDALFATIGLNTEVVIYERDGEWGWRVGFGWPLGSAYSSPGVFDNATGRFLHYKYFNFSFHYTHKRITGYGQLNLATKESGGVFGANYRLWGGGKKTANPEYMPASR